MIRRRKLLRVSTVAAGILLVGRADRAEAIPVFCTNCSTEWDQLLSYAKQVQQVATQLQPVFVVPGWQRRGIATALVSEVLNRLWDAGQESLISGFSPIARSSSVIVRSNFSCA